jgi:hypothetical protein
MHLSPIEDQSSLSGASFSAASVDHPVAAAVAAAAAAAALPEPEEAGSASALVGEGHPLQPQDANPLPAPGIEPDSDEETY